MDVDANRHLLKFAFDGADFEGYARQPRTRTVEDELLRAARVSGVARDARTARFASAGRLDRGVSAVGAVAALDAPIPPGEVARRLNGSAVGLVVHSAAAVEPGFDPRRMASSRWYRYHFPPDAQWTGMDVKRMEEAAAVFVGEHDFSALAKLEGRNPRRRVMDARVSLNGGVLVLDVRGESFLWNQVRRMATAVEMVGAGLLTLEELEQVLSTGRGGPFRTAPAIGLVLMDVEYDGTPFERVESLPKGTVRHIHQDGHAAISKAKYHEYLRQLITQ